MTVLQAGVDVVLGLPAEQLDHAAVGADAPEHRCLRSRPVFRLEVGSRKTQEVPDDVLDADLRAAPDVEFEAADIRGHRAHVGLGNVGDMHEVERCAAVARDDRRLACVDAVEDEAYEPRILSGAVHVHVAKDHVLDARLVAERTQERLAADLARPVPGARIQRMRLVHRLVGVAIDARGGRENDLSDTCLARCVVDVEGPVDIDLEALPRILSTGIEWQHRGVKQPVDAGEDGRQALTIADVARLKAHTTTFERVAEVRLAWFEVEHDDLGSARGE